jgi:hypothetical protein
LRLWYFSNKINFDYLDDDRKGGSLWSKSINTRSARRLRYTKNLRYMDIGFRICLKWTFHSVMLSKPPSINIAQTVNASW